MTESNELAVDRPLDTPPGKVARGTPLQDVLDQALAAIVAGNTTEAIQLLIRTVDEWVPSDPAVLQDIAMQCRAHPLHEILLEEVFCDRSARLPEKRATFRAKPGSDAEQMVRFRRALMARYIDVAYSRTAHGRH